LTLNETGIRVRAYFYFENRTGCHWQDAVSNWLQAERDEQSLAYFVELDRRVAFIRNAYARHRIPLNPNGGLARALAEAEALGKGEKATFAYSRDYLIQLTNDAHVIYAFGGDLEQIVNAGLDVSHHLSNLTAGTTDFGTPSIRNSTIFFKDFEFELFLTSALLQKGLHPTFTPPGDPCGELVCCEIRIEAKHPNSIGQLTKLLGKFQTSLGQVDAFGIFVVALEDAMALGDVSEFDSQAEYDEWLTAKRSGMEALGQKLISKAARLPRIAALIQIQTKVEIVDDRTTLRRLGNSILFDHRPTYSLYADPARAIAAVFNPLPLQYSEYH
jgi:hypothetical protein